jgi:cobalt-zinc-cadmium efflux system outer membrane protein
MRFLQRAGLLLLYASLPAFPQDWTEQTVLQQFLDQNPISRETRARVATAAAESQGRTLWSNPVASVSREGAGRTEFYQVAQSLPLSGRFPLIREAGALQAEVLNAEGGFSLWLARCALRSAFYLTLANQERQRVWADADAELVRFISILETREREGEGSKLDRVRAERERIELAAYANLLGTELATTRGELLAYLPPRISLDRVNGDLTPAEPKGTLATIVERALANRLDLQAERRRLEQFRKERQVANRLRIPEPVVNAGLKRAELGPPALATGPVVGVSLAIPLFNQGKTEVARWSAEEERTAARLEQLTRRVTASAEASWQAYAIHRETLRAYSREVQPSTDELVRIATVAYQEGEIGILQLLDAYRLRRENQLRRIDLASLAKQAQIALEAQIGEDFSQ